MTLYLTVAIGLLVVVNFILWRKLMTTSADLTATATSLASAANALAATATAVSSLVASLKAGQLIDQPTLDSVNTSLSSSLTAIQAAQSELQALVPTS